MANLCELDGKFAIRFPLYKKTVKPYISLLRMYFLGQICTVKVGFDIMNV